MRKLSILGALTFLLVSVGCQSDNGAQKDDEEATAEQSSEKDKGEKHDKKKGDEHPGDEAEGDEHPGDEHPGDEAEGEEHPGDSAENKESYSAEDIKTAMKSHIDGETNSNGIFKIKDKKADKNLELKFVKIHDPVRKMEGKGYFACTDFQVKGMSDKLYDLDFWLQPEDGELTVTKTKIHKHPVKKDGEWTKKARYTFKDDEVVKLD